MIRKNFWLAVVLTAGLPVSAALAQINGIKTNARVFNDFTTTTLAIVNNNSVNAGPVASSASVDESVYTNDGIGGNFANRHDLTFSSDGGATNHSFSINDSYTVSAIFTLAAGSNAPRKEAGFIINPSCCEAQFIINSDAGEIVAFGGPFYSFSSGAQPDYVPGTPILLGYTMTAAGDGNGPLQNSIEYFIDRTPLVAGGIETSGPLPYGNLEGGPPSNYRLSMYSQAQPLLTNPADFIAVDINDIKFSAITRVPEPASCLLSVVGLMGLAVIRRRRTR